MKTLLLAALVLPYTAHAQIAVWMSANDVEASSISGITTEPFNTAAVVPSGVLGNGASYSKTGTVTSVVNNAFGGKNTGNYLKGNSLSTTTLDLSVPAAYFGIYITAADAFNELVISSGGSTLLTYNTTTLLTMLSGPTVQAQNGSFYNSADYFGRPVDNQNPTQAYAYLHFIADTGVTFDKIVLRQLSGSASFESDNHSIRPTAPSVPTTFVNIPEPSSLLLSLTTLGGLVLVRKRK